MENNRLTRLNLSGSSKKEQCPEHVMFTSLQQSENTSDNDGEGIAFER